MPVLKNPEKEPVPRLVRLVPRVATPAVSVKTFISSVDAVETDINAWLLNTCIVGDHDVKAIVVAAVEILATDPATDTTAPRPVVFLNAKAYLLLLNAPVVKELSVVATVAAVPAVNVVPLTVIGKTKIVVAEVMLKWSRIVAL